LEDDEIDSMKMMRMMKDVEDEEIDSMKTLRMMKLIR